MGASFEQLKAKYQPAIDYAKEIGVSLSHVHIDGDKLVVQGAAPNEEIKNEVWNKIKEIDSSFGDLAAEITIDSSLPVPAKTYTVAGGDSLSKIAKQFYGNANAYMKIFEANKDQLSDPNKIQVGQVLKIPQ
jgi:nucleoid-associated protein YgaU